MKYFVYCRKSTEAEERQALSLDSQAAEIARTVAGDSTVHIVEVIRESMSAKGPGRPLFNAMLDRIRKGEADGVIAWHPDRLARNSVDGGQIIYMLDRGEIKNLRFSNFTFENSSQGKFMLQIMFGYSKYYVDNLSENVRRGNRAKVSQGWRPGSVPLGYRNCRETRTIVVDETAMPLVRRIFREALGGAIPASALWRKATESWGLRTPKRKRSGAKPMARSAFFKMLSNVFYTGHFTYRGQLYKGKHEPLLSMEEHQRLIRLIHRGPAQKPQQHKFPFTGLIRCGTCGCMITAEHHVNRYGYQYTYYRCTKRGGYGRCTERYVSSDNLVAQLFTFLESLKLPGHVDSACRRVAKDMRSNEVDKGAVRETTARALEAARSKEATLLDLRLRELVTDEEFLEKRAVLQEEAARLEASIAAMETTSEWFELFDEAISFSSMAVDWFQTGSEDVKRLIVISTGSNLTLSNRKLSIEAAFPFRCMQQTATYSVGWALVDDFRTRWRERDKDLLERLAKIREVRETMIPPGATSPRASARGSCTARGADVPARGVPRRSSPGELSLGGGP